MSDFCRSDDEKGGLEWPGFCDLCLLIWFPEDSEVGTKPEDSGIPWAGWFSYCLSEVLVRVLKDVWFHGTLLAISQLSKPGLNVCIPYKFGYSNFGSDGPTKELEPTRHRNDILDSLLQTLKWPPWGLFVHGKSQTSAGKHVETCLGLSKTTILWGFPNFLSILQPNWISLTFILNSESWIQTDLVKYLVATGFLVDQTHLSCR